MKRRTLKKRANRHRRDRRPDLGARFYADHWADFGTCYPTMHQLTSRILRRRYSDTKIQTLVFRLPMVATIRRGA